MPSLRLLAGMLLCGPVAALAHADTVQPADHDSDGLVAAMRQHNRAQRPLRIDGAARPNTCSGLRTIRCLVPGACR